MAPRKIFEHAEAGLGSFSHRDDNLLAGNGCNISCGINALYSRSAVGVDNNLTELIFFNQVGKRCAVGNESNLHEDTVGRDLMLERVDELTR